MDIFVISLARSPDRKEMFEKYNSQHIDKYTYFEAVDDQTLNLHP